MKGSALLGIESSLMQARWVAPPVDENHVERMVRQGGLPEVVARLLAGRGVAPEQAENFLYPKLARDFPDPFALKGMNELADDLAKAVTGGRRIGVFGDFDVDGATSTALLVRFFRHCGLDVPFYIPDRMKEGYGPNENALRVLKEQGAEIVIMCDCGITAHEVIAAGRAMGLEIVVIDHHEQAETLPPANHVINPKRRDDASGLSMLAACGVTFMVCVAVNARLRDLGFFRGKGIAEAPLKDFLDIVALGTVCDMVPLNGANRLIVRNGLERMVNTQNAGLKALLEVAKVTGAPTPYHLGFALGPRINAGSRVHRADLGARLLSTDDAQEAKTIAWTLNDCNDQRRQMQAEMFDHAVNLVEDGRLYDCPAIIVGHEDWHPGLSGLVAGALKEKYGKPAIVVALGAEGKGSGRSVPGVNLGAVFIEARECGLLIKGGGHAMAAGFTLLPDMLEPFCAFVMDHAARQLEGQAISNDVRVDAVLSVRGANPDLVRLIHDHMGPFGQDHPEPLFALPGVRIHKADTVGTDHVRCMISDWEGGTWMKAMAFKAGGTPLGKALLGRNAGMPLHLAGHFRLDNWSGQDKVEIHITDAAAGLAGSGSAADNLTFSAKSV